MRPINTPKIVLTTEFCSMVDYPDERLLKDVIDCHKEALEEAYPDFEMTVEREHKFVEFFNLLRSLLADTYQLGETNDLSRK